MRFDSVKSFPINVNKLFELNELDAEEVRVRLVLKNTCYPGTWFYLSQIDFPA
jgi:hypothetical protein